MFLGKCSVFQAWDARWGCAMETDIQSHCNIQAPIHKQLGYMQALIFPCSSNIISKLTVIPNFPFPGTMIILPLR